MVMAINPNEIIQKYQAGESSYKLAKEHKTTHHKINTILKKNNIKLRGLKEAWVNREHKPINPQSLNAKKDRGEISGTEYRNLRARSYGFKSHSDYTKYRNHINGVNRPLEVAKETGSYLGVYIAERVLSLIFEDVQRMPYNNVGYDFICKKGYKIDVKCGCLINEMGKYNVWNFNIEKNKIADYFLLLAFDSRNNLEPQHIWLIGGNETIPYIRGRNHPRILNQRKTLRIRPTPQFLNIFKRFEMSHKLKTLKECCTTLRG